MCCCLAKAALPLLAGLVAPALGSEILAKGAVTAGVVVRVPEGIIGVLMASMRINRCIGASFLCAWWGRGSASLPSFDGLNLLQSVLARA